MILLSHTGTVGGVDYGSLPVVSARGSNRTW